MNEQKLIRCMAGKAYVMNTCTVQPVQYNTDKSARVLGGCTVFLIWIWLESDLGIAQHFENPNALKCCAVPYAWLLEEKKLGTIQHFLRSQDSKVLYCPLSSASGGAEFTDTTALLRSQGPQCTVPKIPVYCP